MAGSGTRCQRQATAALAASGPFEAQHHRSACWACRAASDGSAPQGEGARPAHEIEQLRPGGALDAAARDGASEPAQDPANSRRIAAT